MQIFFDLVNQLPSFLATTLLKIPVQDTQKITEIRIRSARPITVSLGAMNRFITSKGTLTDIFDKTVLATTHAQVQECFLTLCHHSIPKYERMIAQGFIPLDGGHRAGVCGSAFIHVDGSFAIKNITSINIRVAHQISKPLEDKLQRLLQTSQSGVLIAGEPGSGKTTVLRQIMQLLSILGKRTSVVDERMELAPVGNHGFLYEIPLYCDVLSGYTKHIGMQHAIRVLSPRVLICDELGANEDIKAVVQAVNSGVQMVASIHASNLQEIKHREQCKKLLQTGAFSHAVILKGYEHPGEIREVVNLFDD